MSAFLLEAPLSEILATCLAVATLGTAFLAQCGANKQKAQKKKAGASQKSQRSAKSVKGGSRKSQRSVKSAKSKSQRSDKALAGKSQKSARGSKQGSKQLSASEKKSERKSARKSARKSSHSNRSAKETKTASADLATAKGHTPAPQVEADNRPSEYFQKVGAELKRDEPSLKSLASLHDTQKTGFSQKEVHTGLVETNNNGPQELHMVPRELRFSEQGGLLRVQLHNPTNTRQAIKVKCSDNAIYRVNPVYGYVEPGQQLNVEVVRQSGTSSKVDKLVFVTAKAPAENVDVKKLFKTVPKSETPLMTLPLLA